jgi:hypothetical protein
MASKSKKTEAARKRKRKPNKANLKKAQKRIEDRSGQEKEKKA